MLTLLLAVCAAVALGACLLSWLRYRKARGAVVTGWSVEKANRRRDCDGGRHVWQASGRRHSSCVHCGESVPEPVDNLMKPPYTGQRRAR